MARTKAQRSGLGFGAGAAAGLVFSAAVLLGLAISQPPEPPAPALAPAPAPAAATPPATAPRQTGTPAPSRPAAAPVPSTPAPAPATRAPSAAAPAAQAPAPVVAAPVTRTPDGAATPAPAPGAPPATPAPATPAPASSGLPDAPATPAPSGSSAPTVAADSSVAALRPATPTPAAPAVTPPPADSTAPPAAVAPAPEPVAPAAATPPAPPPPPLWRAHAADAGGLPADRLMAVVVTGATQASLPALTALAPFGRLAVTVDPEAADAPALAAALRDLGHEVLLMPRRLEADSLAEALDAAVARVPGAAGFAVGPMPPGAARETLLAGTARHGAMLLDTVPGAASALVDAARAEQLPVGGAALSVVAATDATRAFQLLREAGARTAREGQMIVVVEAVPVTLTALGRWLALPGEATPAPLTAVVARLGPTAY